MRLGRKLFLLVGGLLCLLAAGQWLLYRSLSKSVTENVRTLAYKVGEDIVSGFEYEVRTADGAKPRRPLPPLPSAGEASPESGATASESAISESTTAAPPGERNRARVIVMRTTDGKVVRETFDGPPGETGERLAEWKALHFSEDSGEPRGEGTGEGEARGETTNVTVDVVPGTAVRHEWRFKRRSPEPGGATGEGANVTVAEELPGEPFRMAVGVDGASDVLFLRGPEIERSIPIPNELVGSTLERFGSRLLLGNLALLAVGLLAAAFFAHRMTRPLAALADAAERVGEGELGAAVPVVARRDEVGRAVASFNRMSTRLSELDRENRRLTEAERLSELGDVARGLAHSLRNPLNALGLAIERLGARAAAGEERSDTDAASSSATEALVEGSRRQIRRIDGALRSFLALASTGAVATESVDVAALAREVALEALQDASAAGDRGGPPRIEVELADSGPHVVDGVAAELKAILQALVVNACEANAAAAEGDPERRPRRVTLRVARRPDGRGVVCTVDDEGAGVAASVRERLFTPHVTTKPHGSGMGLFLAHRLATTRYGGAIRVAPLSEGAERAERAERAEGAEGAEGAPGTRATVELGPREVAA